jgi:hypothetical protein
VSRWPGGVAAVAVAGWAWAAVAVAAGAAGAWGLGASPVDGGCRSTESRAPAGWVPGWGRTDGAAVGVWNCERVCDLGGAAELGGDGAEPPMGVGEWLLTC